MSTHCGEMSLVRSAAGGGGAPRPRGSVHAIQRAERKATIMLRWGSTREDILEFDFKGLGLAMQRY